MALQKSIIENVRLIGDVRLVAYIKVATVSGNKDDISAEVHYIKDNKDGEFIKVKTFTFRPNLTAGNFFEQAYNHLKTLPDFLGVVDC